MATFGTLPEAHLDVMSATSGPRVAKGELSSVSHGFNNDVQRDVSLRAAR